MFSRRTLIAATAAFALGFISFAQPTPARADTADEPTRLIQVWGAEMLDILKVKDVQERRARFRKLLATGVDVELLSRFVLGRYSRQVTAEKQDEFRDLFREFLVTTYSQRLGILSDLSLTVKGSQKLNENETLVTTHVEKPGAKPLRLDWRLRARDGGYKIVDVMMEGISMAVTQREEFTAVIQNNNNNIDALLDRLRGSTVASAG